jgi:hydrogenase maturation protein HypF
MPTAEPASDLLIRVRGTVQGVGFRPFVHRIASRLQLGGWVRNDQQGVLIRAVGPTAKIAALEQALRDEVPAAAHVLSIEEQMPAPELPGADGSFIILESDAAGEVEASIPPDLALCAACRAELGDPADRRYRYPFINCTQCGPRYSIVDALPYDRPKTTMRAFRMCPACQSEYDNPASRRFHAQPNACPVCGPSVRLTTVDGGESAVGDEAVQQAGQRIASGQIIALRGVGGYHLLVDATNDAAVLELRRRKHRDEKPFAVMFAGLGEVERFAHVNDVAAEALTSIAAPIVLLPRRPEAPLAHSVAPGNPWVGAFLAYAPVHVLLLEAIGRPLVATSGNLADEPLCTAPDEAHRRLAKIADAFLDHDRPIAHPVDDSVLRVARAGTVLLRRARGYAPSPLQLPAAVTGKWLCVGAQMKNTLAVATGDRVVLSPHIGDLGGAATADVFHRTARTLAELHGGEFTAVASDKHPDYSSSRYADALGLPRVAVQHHLAHVLACLLEHRRPADDVLGVVWDGTGYGEDGTIWGGEFLLLRANTALRFGRLHPFQIPGGEAAIRDPRRVALGLFHGAEELRQQRIAQEIGFSDSDAATLWRMLERGLNSPVTSSAGRLFDGIGALLGVGRHNQFEGQTPLRVEAAAMAGPPDPDSVLPMPIGELPSRSAARYELDWRPLLESLIAERRRGTSVNALATAFHRALATGIVAMARRAGVGTIALSGGCFQNALLLDLTVEALRAEHFDVLVHRELPPNDGNIAAGQALGVLWNLTTVTLP